MLLESNAEQDSFLTTMSKIAGQVVAGDEIELELLIDEISKYDIFDFICRISALNLLIENQNKSILFDALIAGILSRDRATYLNSIKMSSGKFRNIIAKLNNLGLSRLIDPSENAFMERVRYYGNYWIFSGINYSPSFCLQGFLDVICHRGNGMNQKFINKAHQIINYILFVSDRAAQKMGYDMNIISHCEVKQIKVPDAVLLDQLKQCVSLDLSLVEDLIADKTLHPCLFTEFSKADLSLVLNGDKQKFFNQPFLKENGNKVILLNPSILVPFAIHQIVLLADKFKCKDVLIDAYNNEIWKSCRKSLTRLEHKKIQEEFYGIDLINNKSYKEIILSVGTNKLLFVHFLCDAGDKYKSDSMFDKHLIADNHPSVYKRASYFIDHLPELSNESIYQLIILNSFGRAILSKSAGGTKQDTIVLSPFELNCISINERNHDCFIPRYIDAKRKFGSIIPSMMSSELNSIEIYTTSDYSFYISDEFDLASTNVMFGLGDSLDYIIRAIKREDRHLIDSYDGIHLREIVLDDPTRSIYFTEGFGKRLPELVIKFAKVNIWITTDKPNNYEEANIYYSIVDTISYWLAECKSVINSMFLSDNTLCINIVIRPPIDEYSRFAEHEESFNKTVQYEHHANKINMEWKPLAFQMLGIETNRIEKDMIVSVIQELEKISDLPANINVLDGIFTPPLKKKCISLNIEKYPFLAPIDGKIPIVSAEEENQLLDEIGAHFLELPEYTYGRVPDDKRVELTNKVVGYLYSLLQCEIAAVKSDGVFEQVCFDLETVMRQIMLYQKRYAYDISCYPERAQQMVKQHNEANKSSVALKFLAEYIVAVPPCGTKVLGTMQYDRILAICSLIIDWAYKNDQFKYQIFNSPVEFLKSGRIGMSRVEGDYLADINESVRTKRLENLSDPMVDIYSPSNLIANLPEKLDLAFSEEYGFTFQQFMQCVFAIMEYGEELAGDVKRAQRTRVITEIINRLDIPTELVKKIIDQISLTQRDDFLVPPKPFEKYDIYPWRFNRELSVTRRPIMQYNNDLIWGNRQLHHMWRFMLDLIIAGKYKARKTTLKQLIGTLSHKRGNDFNAAVARKLSAIDGLIIRENVSKINNKKITNADGNVLGDIDLLYIVPQQYKIVVGEVKDFSFAKNSYEMDQEYKRIFVDGDKPCYITKHRRRVEWVKAHIDDIIQDFGIPKGKWSVQTVLFTSEEIVSNAFYHKGEKIIVYSDISERNVKAV